MNAEIVPLMPPADVSGNWRARFKPSPTCGQVVGAEAIAAIDFVEYEPQSRSTVGVSKSRCQAADW